MSDYYTLTYFNGAETMDNAVVPNGMESHTVVFHQPQFAVNRYKIALIGAPKVGKTAIAQRICHNRFDNHIDNAPLKQAVQLKLPDQMVAKVEVIDIAPNKFASENDGKKLPRSSDFVDVSGVLVVYDLTDRTSFDQIPELLCSLKSLIPPDCEVMLVGNKSDLISTIGRAVTFTDADKYAQKSGMSLFEMSAKSGEHCKEAVIELVQKVREKWQLRPFHSPLSSSTSTDDSCDENVYPKQSLQEDCVEKPTTQNRIWCSLWRCS